MKLVCKGKKWKLAKIVPVENSAMAGASGISQDGEKPLKNFGTSFKPLYREASMRRWRIFFG